jgi:hypothetical protein
MNEERTGKWLRQSIGTYPWRAASLARTNLLLSATSDGLFMDELESITMTTSLYLGDTVAANSDL